MSVLRTKSEKEVYILTDGPGGGVFYICESLKDAETIQRWHRKSFYRGVEDIPILTRTVVTEAEVER